MNLHPNKVEIPPLTSDHVWNTLRIEAAEVVQREPFLNQLVKRTILDHVGFDHALVARLVLRLDSVEASAGEFAVHFEKAVSAEIGIVQSAMKDLVAVLDRDPACHRVIDPFLYFKGWQAIQCYRVANWFWKQGRKDFAYFVQSRTSLVTSVDIHPAAQIGSGIMIDHGHGVVIGETCLIEDNVTLMQGVTLGGNGKETGDRHPKIRQGVLIGAGAKILGNIEIGRASRVAAGSVVLHPVPPNTTVAGIPAKVVGSSGSKEPATIMDHKIEAEDG